MVETTAVSSVRADAFSNERQVPSCPDPQGGDARYRAHSAPHQQLRRPRHHAGAHRVRTRGDPRFSVATLMANCSVAALFTSTSPDRQCAPRRSRACQDPRCRQPKLVEALAAEAGQYELHAVFAFTYVTEFFSRVGFEVVERGALPLKAWKDCVRCPKFQQCDEIAVLRILRPLDWQEAQPQSWGAAMISPTDELIQIPTPRK